MAELTKVRFAKLDEAVTSFTGGNAEPTDHIAVNVTSVNRDEQNPDASSITGTRVDTGEEVTLVQRPGKEGNKCPLSKKIREGKGGEVLNLKKEGGFQVGIDEGTTVIAESVFYDEEAKVYSASQISGLNTSFDDNGKQKMSKILNDGKYIPVSLSIYKGKVFNPKNKVMEDSETAGHVTVIRGDAVEGVVGGSIQDVINAAASAVVEHQKRFGMMKRGLVTIVDPDTGTTITQTAIPNMSDENYKKYIKEGVRAPRDAYYQLGTDEGKKAQLESFVEHLTSKIERISPEDANGDRAGRDKFATSAAMARAAIVLKESHSLTSYDLNKYGFEITKKVRNGEVYNSFAEAAAAERAKGGTTYYPAIMYNETPAGGASSDYARINTSQPEMSEIEATVMAVATQFPDLNREAVLNGITSAVETAREARASWANQNSNEHSAPTKTAAQAEPVSATPSEPASSSVSDSSIDEPVFNDEDLAF